MFNIAMLCLVTVDISVRFAAGTSEPENSSTLDVLDACSSLRIYSSGVARLTAEAPHMTTFSSTRRAPPPAKAASAVAQACVLYAVCDLLDLAGAAPTAEWWASQGSADDAAAELDDVKPDRQRSLPGDNQMMRYFDDSEELPGAAQPAPLDDAPSSMCPPQADPKNTSSTRRQLPGKAGAGDAEGSVTKAGVKSEPGLAATPDIDQQAPQQAPASSATKTEFSQLGHEGQAPSPNTALPADHLGHAAPGDVLAEVTGNDPGLTPAVKPHDQKLKNLANMPGATLNQSSAEGHQQGHDQATVVGHKRLRAADTPYSPHATPLEPPLATSSSVPAGTERAGLVVTGAAPCGIWTRECCPHDRKAARQGTAECQQQMVWRLETCLDHILLPGAVVVVLYAS